MASIYESELDLSHFFATSEQYDGQLNDRQLNSGQLYGEQLNGGQIHDGQLYNTQLYHGQLNGEQPSNEITDHFGTCQATCDGLGQFNMDLSINNFSASIVEEQLSQLAFGNLGRTSWDGIQNHVQDPDITGTPIQQEVHGDLMISYPCQEGHFSNTPRFASDSWGYNHHNVITSPWHGYPEDIQLENFYPQQVSIPHQRMNGSQEHTIFPPVKLPQPTDHILWERDPGEMWIFDANISPDLCRWPEGEHYGHQCRDISSVQSQPGGIINDSQNLNVPRISSSQQRQPGQPHQFEQQLTKRNSLSHSPQTFLDVDAQASTSHCLSYPTAVPDRKRTHAKVGICAIGKDKGDVDRTMKRAKTGTKSKTNFQTTANSKILINMDNIKMYGFSEGSFGEMEATSTRQTNSVEEKPCTLCRLTADGCTMVGTRSSGLLL